MDLSVVWASRDLSECRTLWKASLGGTQALCVSDLPVHHYWLEFGSTRALLSPPRPPPSLLKNAFCSCTRVLIRDCPHALRQAGVELGVDAANCVPVIISDFILIL